MIPKKAAAGGRTAGLLYYLYGPGRANEHTDPHMVAAWDAGVLDPAVSSGATIPTLAMLLDAPVAMLEGKAPAQHVYHVPVRNEAGDRRLSDEEWADVAREIMDAAGIAPKGDPMGARWVAIRHADDHIHIVATLARQDGRPPDLWRDRVKMQARARELEVRYGLRRLTSGDKTASRWPTTAEMEKAKRHGRTETPRETLRRAVREAAAAAGSDEEFFAAIERAGLRLNRRMAPDGTVTGYSVALPGDRTAQSRAVWYSGTRLAPDLSLPRVRERWSGTTVSAAPARPQSRAEAWQRAAAHVHQAAAVLGSAGDEGGAAEVRALGDFLATFAAQAPAEVRDELRAAATAYERAGRAPTSRRLDTAAATHLRTAAQLVALGAAVAADGGESTAALALLVAAALAVTAAMRWHQARQHAAQERAAAQAGSHLRAATEIAYGAAGRRSATRASNKRAAPEPFAAELTARYEQAVRTAIPALADRVLSEEAWPALAAVLRQAETAGYDPGRVLAEVAAIRSFGDADSAAEVLVWRLGRRMDEDARSASAVAGQPTVTALSPPSNITPEAPAAASLNGEPEASTAGDGQAVVWRIAHSEFNNDVFVSKVDGEETGVLPAGVDPQVFARARFDFFASSGGYTDSTSEVYLYAAERGPDGRRVLLARFEPPKKPATTAPTPAARTAAARQRTEDVRLGGAESPTFGTVVRSAVPDHAAQVMADPASATLTAYLIKAAGEGHDPAALLAEVAGARDLGDAASVAQVLTWRLQGRLRRAPETPARAVARRATRPPVRPTGPARLPGEQSAAERAAQEAARRRGQSPGPRR
ncbi:relaxase/mobilization nuclease domain-containing protein [Streptomyces sp. NRRL WC-3742]|uniref:relaxase/mobilization nuclease domain-containing protein n=1 Tax=Streptomyces sp. NRRL WC-3742 TaxID=1463934 RepID=UPI0006918B8B|nr:hypothetical protein [Streptomyces sp. NRRL WC-3742]